MTSDYHHNLATPAMSLYIHSNTLKYVSNRDVLTKNWISEKCSASAESKQPQGLSLFLGCDHSRCLWNTTRDWPKSFGLLANAISGKNHIFATFKNFKCPYATSKTASFLTLLFFHLTVASLTNQPSWKLGVKYCCKQCMHYIFNLENIDKLFFSPRDSRSK